MVVDDAAAPAETLHNRHNLTGGLPMQQKSSLAWDN